MNCRAKKSREKAEMRHFPISIRRLSAKSGFL